MDKKNLEFMRNGAEQAASLLHIIGNQYRLLVLCLLIEHKEMTVSAMLDYVDLSQSALSQHLAKMREAELISYRREAQTLYYHIKHPAVQQIVATLKSIYCP